MPPPLQAYPSTSNMQQLSYRSDGSLLASETPRSNDGGELERKVRGGMSRSLSHAAGLSSPAPAALPAGPGSQSHASLLAWEQRGGGGRRGGMAERGLSSSSLGSPGGESLLSGTPSESLSPQQSPAVVPLGGYSRLVPAPPAHQALTRVQAVPLLQPTGPLAGPGGCSRAALGVRAQLVDVRAEVVQRGTRLSRSTTDTAGLVQAVDALARAAAAAAAARAAPGT